MVSFNQMKKTKTAAESFRIALLCMLAFMLPVLNSCKKESADVTDLLSSVPSSAGVVVGFNLQSLLEKSGCKVDGSEITPGAEVASFLESRKDVKSSEREIVKLILNGESGIDPVGAIFFTDAYSSYLTVSIADTQKFTDFVEKQSGQSFADAGIDVRTCANVAIKGAQAWVCVSSDDAIDNKAIANYSTLAEGQSFVSNGFASNISTMTNDIVGWGEIKGIMKAARMYGEMTTVNLLSGMLFEDAASLSFTMDFLKGKLESSVSVLNSKGKPAKYLLPADKIDVATVKSIAKTAQMYGAVCVTKDLVKKLEKMASSFGGSSAAEMFNSLKTLDGTVAVAFSDDDSFGDNISGVVTTDGAPTLDLMSLISRVAPVRKEDNLVRFSKGAVKGEIDVEESADLLKGSTMGVVMDMQSKMVNAGSDFRTLAISLVPASGGIKVDITVESADDSKNILLSLLSSGAI